VFVLREVHFLEPLVRMGQIGVSNQRGASGVWESVVEEKGVSSARGLERLQMVSFPRCLLSLKRCLNKKLGKEGERM
jgi:hypothetical protein